MSHLFFRTAKGTENQNFQIATNAFLSDPKLSRPCIATISKDPNITSPYLHEPVYDISIISLPSMYSFIFMNVACLLTQTKRKNKALFDLCDRSTLFLCLCETFLHKGILNGEIKISGFSIVIMSRAGGGVCVYVSNSTTYDICLAYSNYVCE